MDSFTILTNALPRLSPMQLQDIKGRVTMLLKGAAVDHQTSGPADMADHVLMLIADYCQKESLEFSSLTTLRATNGYASFKRQAFEVIKWMDSVARNRVEFDALVRIILRLLRKDIKRRNWEVNARILMRCFYEVPGLMEQSFPGYYRLGVLGVVIFASEKRNTGKELASCLVKTK